MRERMAALIEELGYAELQKLRELLVNGGLREHVERNIERYENPHGICPVCERPVDENEDIVLMFGPMGLRKKARFCGSDCLEYFLAELKQHRTEDIE